jgi:hypothetical protein
MVDPYIGTKQRPGDRVVGYVARRKVVEKDKIIRWLEGDVWCCDVLLLLLWMSDDVIIWSVLLLAG